MQPPRLPIGRTECLCLQGVAIESQLLYLGRVMCRKTFPLTVFLCPFPALAQGCHTSSESTDGMLAMLSGIGDGLAEVMAHALDFVSLDVEQGVKTYTTIVKVSVT